MSNNREIVKTKRRCFVILGNYFINIDNIEAIKRDSSGDAIINLLSGNTIFVNDYNKVVEKLTKAILEGPSVEI